MKIYMLAFLIFAVSGKIFAGSSGIDAEKDTEQWGIFEISLKGPSTGNPFRDVVLKAEFSNGKTHIKIDGFYDGNGLYKLRFMPEMTGEWRYRTTSNSKLLDNKTGSFLCVKPSPGNHGPVRVSGTYHFKYADSTRYYPFGTTVYAMTHQQNSLEETTLQTLKASPFNKLRLCVFPKYYTNVENEPVYYPYEKSDSARLKDGKIKYSWNFDHFNPEFFEHLEKRITDLQNMGIEADLIIFHPYDKGHWGFDSMGKENDLRYIKYLVARLASFRNVWWSMANEFDYIKTKTRGDWDVYSKAVVQADPYHHLCSIHNGSVYYDHWKPEFTHVSIQNGAVVEEPGRAVLLRDVYFKPVIYDEVCYEGDLTQRWGQLSGEEMTYAFWQGILAGTYVTHGETYNNPDDVVFWAKGGKLVGSSPQRIGFLRKILEAGPGAFQLADPWKDNITAMADSNNYLVYFGKEMQTEWTFNLPKKNGPKAGTKFKVELIDTWDMTVRELTEPFTASEPDGYKIFDKERKAIKLPLKPYLALRITAIK